MKLRLLQSPSQVIYNLENTVSLYRRCLNLRKRLMDISELAAFFDSIHREALNSSFKILEFKDIEFDDPVTEIWLFCRLGYPLCALFNCLPVKQKLEVNSSVSLENTNVCKASLYRFMLMCKNELGLTDADLFSISEIYKPSTAPLVRALQTIELLLKKYEVSNTTKSSSTPSPSTDDNVPTGTLNSLIASGRRVTAELYETELKYIQDLEYLSNYMVILQQKQILSQDTILSIFTNLNEILDFQRRFLVGLEMNLSLPVEEQRLGALFIALEEGFSVYQVFCTNFPNAQQLIIDNQNQLLKVANLLEPSYELPALLIKPIQRICKYPLLLNQLLKGTPSGYQYEEELKQGMACVVRVANQVNETRRIHENRNAIIELEQRVIDWKGYSLQYFGQLLVWDVVNVCKADIEREYHVYLFEKILLCCKEMSTLKRQARSISMNKKTKRLDSLQLKGRILTSNITTVVPNHHMGSYAIQIFWRGDPQHESFILKLRNEESHKLWMSVLNRLLWKNEHGSPKDIRSAASTPANPVYNRSSSQTSKGYNSSDYDLLRTHSLDENVNSPTSISSPSSKSSPFTKTTSKDTKSATTTDERPSDFIRLNSEESVGTSSLRTSQTTSTIVSNDSSSTASIPSQISRISQVNSLLNDYNYNRQSHITRVYSGTDDGSSVSIFEDTSSSTKQKIFDQPTTNDCDVMRPRQYSYSAGMKSDGSLLPSTKHTSLSSSSTSTSLSVRNTTNVKIRLRLHEVSLVLVVAHDITFDELLAKVEHKIKLCGILKQAVPFRVRLKYVDEDGDFITITSDEDVLMAFETCTFELMDPVHNKGMDTVSLHVVVYF